MVCYLTWCVLTLIDSSIHSCSIQVSLNEGVHWIQKNADQLGQLYHKIYPIAKVVLSQNSPTCLSYQATKIALAKL